MPNHKSTDQLEADGWMSILLALRLRQIESKFESYADFADRTGLSRGTLYQLRTGKANPTFQTVEKLARSLEMSVWELMGVRERHIRDDVASFGLNYDEISEHLEASRKVRKRVTAFSGIPDPKKRDNQ